MTARAAILALLTGCTTEAKIAPSAFNDLADTAAPLDTAAPADTVDTAPAEDTGPPPCPLLDGALPVGPEGPFLAQGASVSGERPRCEAVLHATAGAAGSTLSAALEDWEGEAALTVTSLLGEVIAGPLALAPGESASFSLVETGEVFLTLAPTDPDAAADTYTLSVACAAGCDAAFTRYPVVLMHGMGGTDSYIGLYDYYFGVTDALTAAGYRVEAPAVDAFDTIPDRAAQWQAALDDLEAAGVGRRFNLIGHSQGGLDARYVAGGLLDDRVASVVTVGSPHRGSVVADAAAGVLDLGPWDGALVDLAVEALSGIIGLEGDDLTAETAELTTDAMAAFNEEILDVDGVYYASWAGHSCGALDWWCQADWSGEVVEGFLAPTYAIVALFEGDNDGLVSVESATWGDHQGEIPADHMDEVGQIADVWNPAFDHEQFYLDEAARLAGLGL